VEIKWGAIAGEVNTDMKMAFQEQLKMRNTLSEPAICRARGPAVMNGKRYRSKIFNNVRNYTVDHDTKLLLVTDFASIKVKLPYRFLEFKNQWKSSDLAIVADINDRIEGIPGVRDLLCHVE
jgi:hypothetical protein